ncbi:MAG: hypothetical protein ACK53L_00115, partial [Pirellulaceae bacterium]
LPQRPGHRPHRCLDRSSAVGFPILRGIVGSVSREPRSWLYRPCLGGPRPPRIQSAKSSASRRSVHA